MPCRSGAIRWASALLTLVILTPPWPAVNHWGYFIYLNWMPTYFYRVLGQQSGPVCGWGGWYRVHRTRPAILVWMPGNELPLTSCKPAGHACRPIPEGKLDHQPHSLGRHCDGRTSQLIFQYNPGLQAWT